MARASRRANQGVNIQAVADHAGVSAMTVSNVINGRRKVRETTREAVMAAVKELGYKPNIAAQALASAASVRLGLLVGTAENAFLSSILVGTLAATTNLGAQLLLHRIDSVDPARIREALESLMRSGATTILAAPPYCEVISRTLLAAQIDIPIMAMSSGDALPNLPTVRIDDFAAARDMTRHLIGLGHRRIGFVRGPETHIISHTRQGGYRAALDEAGIAWDPALVSPGDLTYESGLAAAEYLLGLDERPTAIFASNDDMAAAIVSLAHRRGLRIPGNLSIAGFDDTPIAVKIWPTLTTVRQPVALIAERAATLAIQATRAPQTPDAPKRLVADYLPYELIERESTAAPPAPPRA
jgi:LacI family transcriptional regulator